jgi:hypothetical protein
MKRLADMTRVQPRQNTMALEIVPIRRPRTATVPVRLGRSSIFALWGRLWPVPFLPHN